MRLTRRRPIRSVLFTGLRRGELLGASWAALDLDEGWLEVGQQVVMVANIPTLKATPKTDDSWETIALDAATVATLRELPVFSMTSR